MSIGTAGFLNGTRSSVDLIMYNFRTHGQFPALPKDRIKYSVRASDDHAVSLNVDIEIAAVVANEMYRSCVKCSNVIDEPLFLYSDSTLKVVYAEQNSTLEVNTSTDAIDAIVPQIVNSLKAGKVAITVEKEDVKFVLDTTGRTLMRLFPSEDRHLPLLCFDDELYKQTLNPSMDSIDRISKIFTGYETVVVLAADTFGGASASAASAAMDTEPDALNSLDLLAYASATDDVTKDNSNDIMKHATELLAETCVWYATEASKEEMPYFNSSADARFESVHLADTVKLLYVEAYLVQSQ